MTILQMPTQGFGDNSKTNMQISESEIINVIWHSNLPIWKELDWKYKILANKYCEMVALLGRIWYSQFIIAPFSSKSERTSQENQIKTYQTPDCHTEESIMW